MSITIEELNSKRARLKSELEDIEATIRVLQSHELSNGQNNHSTSPKANDDPAPSVFSETGEIDLDKLELPAKTRINKPTLEDEVRGIVSRISAEFTVTHVYAALKQMGKDKNDAKHYRNRVSITVKKLAEDGFVERTYKGKGNEPHRYRRATNVRNMMSEKEKYSLA